MEPYHIDAVFASDLTRALETAKIMTEQWDNPLQVNIREGLRETDFGELTYQTDEDIKIRYKEFMESRYTVEEDWAYPGGESGKEVFERAYKVLKELIDSSYKNVAVVTHGGTIRVLLAGLFQQGQKNRLMFGKCMERGGFTELFYDEATGRITLERFNDFAHLEGYPECMMRKEE
jgi:broad specificity phosphatase PhoE